MLLPLWSCVSSWFSSCRYCVSLTPWLSWFKASRVWLVFAEADVVLMMGVRFPLFESSAAKTGGDMLDDSSIAVSIISISLKVLDNQLGRFVSVHLSL